MTTTDKRPVRIVPVLKDRPGHEGYVDGFIVHPDDRVTREVGAEKPKAKRERKR